MKSLIRKGATALTVGGIVVGSLIVAGLQAFALTTEQVEQQLRHVPVFTITDESGSPLVSEFSQQGEDVPPVTQVFISQDDAQAFIDNLRTDDPELASTVRITPVSLARIYEVALQGQESDTRLEFMFVPDREQVQSAVSIIQEELQESESGETVDEFAGVPLFTARSQSESQNDETVGYLTIQQGEQEIIPVFFMQEDLEVLLSEIRESQPDLAGNLELHVIRLEDLIYTLETSDNSELQQIRLIPSSDTLRFLQQQAQQQQQQQQ